MSCTGSGAKLRLELEQLYERKSLVTAAIAALERWRDVARPELKPDRNCPEPSNLTTCRRA